MNGLKFPIGIWLGRKPIVKLLRLYECILLLDIDGNKWDIFNLNARMGIFKGYCR